MSWTGGITASSLSGTTQTLTPDVADRHKYTIASFTVPKAGIYKFELYGSGGEIAYARNVAGNGYEQRATGGSGGYTSYSLDLQPSTVIHLACGGAGSCSFISSSAPTNTSNALTTVLPVNVYAVAGGGGTGGATHDNNNLTGYNCIRGAGGNGGGESGTAGEDGREAKGGAAGTATTGYAYGKGDIDSGWGAEGDYYGSGGYAGEGWYGGRAGGGSAYSNGARAGGGGGGSGYIQNKSLGTMTTGGGATEGKLGYIRITYQGPAQLPVMFNGTAVTKINFNGTDVTHVVFNGTQIY